MLQPDLKPDADSNGFFTTTVAQGARSRITSLCGSVALMRQEWRLAGAAPNLLLRLVAAEQGGVSGEGEISCQRRAADGGHGGKSGFSSLRQKPFFPACPLWRRWNDRRNDRAGRGAVRQKLSDSNISAVSDLAFEMFGRCGVGLVSRRARSRQMGHAMGAISGSPGAWLGWLVAALAVLAPTAGRADEVIALTYDSQMDMVRPESHPGLVVHHELQIRIAPGERLSEERARSARQYSDHNATVQVLGSSDEAAGYVSWRTAPDGTLVRTQNDAQSTRTMTVTLLAGGKCRLDVIDTLKPGFSEYAFPRISSHTVAYFSSYRVTRTSCAMH